MSDAIRAQLASIVASPGFVAAGRLAPFLTFLVERALAGEPLKESVVGVEVFGRPADYDPRLDPIVRVEARRLRSRLAEYYEGAGAGDTVVIELPKGTYVPVFRTRELPSVVREETSPKETAPAAGRHRAWGLTAAALVLAVITAGIALSRRAPPQSPAVAVLPFLDLSDTAANPWFSEGLAEEIIDRLARLRGLRVVARSSSSRFRGSAQDLREVGRQLKATAVVEGSVRRAGDRLRITAQLVNVADGFQLWSQTYERQTKDVFEIQDDVARAVANALRVELRVGFEARPQPPTGNPDAHDLYLEGRYHLNHDAIAGLELAADSFARATEADPRYAEAQAALAETYALLAYYRLRPPREAWPLARAAAERALALDPLLAEAHAARGLALAHDEWKWAEAEPYFRRAVELDPASCEVRIALVWGLLLPRGLTKEAARNADEAVVLDPFSSLAQQLRSFVLLVEGRADDAVASYRRTVELNPSNGDMQWDLGMALAYAGQKEAAMRQFRVGGNVHTGGDWQPGPTEYALLGEPEKARSAIARWPRFHEQRHIFVAYAYALLGDAENAAVWLDRAREERDPQVVWAKVDPRLAKVRQDPRIQAVIRKIGL
jgi:TolB-like protein/tetratricopeptide (TPR) repeat protein